MKLLIVDDDVQIRTGIEQGIDWPALEIGQVATAANGIEALRLFDELSPEIVLTDVRMPGMDGLELLRRIKEINAKTKVIILSGYDEFAYLKKAIQLGAVDYELKPIRTRRFVALIRKVKEDIVREQLTEQEFLKYLQSYKTSFTNQLMAGKLSDPPVILEGLRRCYDFELSGTFVCISIQADGDRENGKDASEAALDLVEQLYRSVDDPSRGVCLRSGDGRIMLIIKTESNSYLYYQSFVNEWANRLRAWNRETRRLCQTTFSAGISSPNTVTEFASLCQEANQALHMRFYQGDGCVHIHDPELKISDRAIVGLLDDETFKSCLARTDFASMEAMLHEDFERLGALREYSRRSVSKYCRNLLHLLLASAGTISADKIEFIQNKMEQLERDEDYLTINDFKETVIAVFTEVGSQCARKLSPAMMRAEEFIQQHYTQEITVKMVADHVGLSPNYFSHVFNKEFGVSFSEYVNRLRISEAKQLIVRTNDPIYLISEKVGYPDHNYFTQVFKRLEGIPPAALRRHGSEGAD